MDFLQGQRDQERPDREKDRDKSEVKTGTRLPKDGKERLKLCQNPQDIYGTSIGPLGVL